MEGETCRQGSQALYALIHSGPRPLAVTKHVPLLVLPTPEVDPHLKEMERRLGVSQLGSQKAMIKQMQSLTYKMSLMIRSQQPSPPPPVESDRHASGLWCVQCGQPRHTKQFCTAGHTRDQIMNSGPPPQKHRGQGHYWYGQGNYRGPHSRGQVGLNVERKRFHHFCRRWRAHGQYWFQMSDNWL